MRNAVTWVDETDITDRLIGQGEVTSVPISDACRLIAENIYRTLIEGKAPVYGAIEMRTPSDAMVSHEWGYFPLSNDGVNVTGGLEIESPDRRVVGVAPADTFMRRG